MSAQGGIRLGRRQVQLIPWLLWLGLMLAGGYYRHYMAGWQAWLLLVALAILVFVLFAGLLETAEDGQACQHGHDHGPRPSLWETLLHLAPLAIFLAMGPTSVAGLAGNLAGRPHAVAPAQAKPQSAVTALAQALRPQGALTADGFQRLNLLELYDDLDNRNIFARQVEVEGRVHVLNQRDRARARKMFGVSGVDITLYRYLIICCAADAQPVFVVLKGVAPKSIGEDQWMRVRGTTDKFVGKPEFLTLNVQSMEKIREPSMPYLFPGVK